MTLYRLDKWSQGKIEEIEATRLTEKFYYYMIGRSFGTDKEMRRFRKDSTSWTFETREEAVAFWHERLRSKVVDLREDLRRAVDDLAEFQLREGPRVSQ